MGDKVNKIKAFCTGTKNDQWQVFLCVTHESSSERTFFILFLLLQTAPVVFCCHKIGISFIHSTKRKEKQTRNLIFTNIFVCLILTLKNVQLLILLQMLCLSLFPSTQFAFLPHTSSFPTVGRLQPQWRPPVLAYKIDGGKEQTELNILFRVSAPAV